MFILFAETNSIPNFPSNQILFLQRMNQNKLKNLLDGKNQLTPERQMAEYYQLQQNQNSFSSAERARATSQSTQEDLLSKPQ